MNVELENSLKRPFEEFMQTRPEAVRREYGAHFKSYVEGAQSQQALIERLVSALDTCWNSLQTYGQHPIIEIEVNGVMRDYLELHQR